MSTFNEKIQFWKKFEASKSDTEEPVVRHNVPKRQSLSDRFRIFQNRNSDGSDTEVKTERGKSIEKLSASGKLEPFHLKEKEEIKPINPPSVKKLANGRLGPILSIFQSNPPPPPPDYPPPPREIPPSSPSKVKYSSPTESTQRKLSDTDSDTTTTIVSERYQLPIRSKTDTFRLSQTPSVVVEEFTDEISTRSRDSRYQLPHSRTDSFCTLDGSVSSTVSDHGTESTNTTFSIKRRQSIRKVIDDAGRTQFVLQDIIEREIEPFVEVDSDRNLSFEDSPARLKKKETVRQEFVSSEQTYVKNLDTLVNHFVIPLKNDVKFGLSPSQASQLFANVDTLAQLHAVMLVDLENASSHNFAKVILKSADFLKMYTAYVNRYEMAIEIMNKQAKNKRFMKYIDGKRETLNMDLMSFLIMPVQRIPRYELLLKEMLKFTLPSDEDFTELVQAHGKIQEIAYFVNDRKKHVEQMFEMLNLQNKVSNLSKSVSLFSQSRYLIAEGECLTLTRKKNGPIESGSQVLLFLCTDVLLLTTTSYKCINLLYLEDLSLVELPHILRSMYDGVMLVSGKEEIWIVFNTEKRRDEWVQKILRAKTEARQVKIAEPKKRVKMMRRVFSAQIR